MIKGQYFYAASMIVGLATAFTDGDDYGASGSLYTIAFTLFAVAVVIGFININREQERLHREQEAKDKAYDEANPLS